MGLHVQFREGRLDEDPGRLLVGAMRAEMDVLYEGFDLDGATMPKAGPAELGPGEAVGWGAR